MLLIATDEAGYGPKLGPLVIVATAWRIPDSHADLAASFDSLRGPHHCKGIPIVIDDSKSVYQPGQGLHTLHTIVSASLHWCEHSERSLVQSLPNLAPQDIETIRQSPWLAQLDDVPYLSPLATIDLRAAWSATGIRQLDTQARIITAMRFNQHCESGRNKADLLSESTISLVKAMLVRQPMVGGPVQVFCDRHGGRRYYAGVLQHVFPDAQLRVIGESKTQSVYALRCHREGDSPREVQIHFTVKGDSFAPVAMSSIHAKYLRERFMQSLNGYFIERHQGHGPPKPTAGYPQDAGRFLTEIAGTLRAESIAHDQLVRQR